MSFASVIQGETIYGNERVTYGTFQDTSSTGGDINTGLHQCVDIQLTAAGGSIVADAPTVNKTLPCDGSAVTIICTTSTGGRWKAYGY